MATLHAPSHLSSCSFDGTEYTVKDGTVEVPDRAVPHLLAHGFTKGKELLAVLTPHPTISVEAHESLKSDHAAAEQLLKEQESELAELRENLIEASKEAASMLAEAQRSLKEQESLIATLRAAAASKPPEPTV